MDSVYVCPFCCTYYTQDGMAKHLRDKHTMDISHAIWLVRTKRWVFKKEKGKDQEWPSGLRQGR